MNTKEVKITFKEGGSVVEAFLDGKRVSSKSFEGVPARLRFYLQFFEDATTSKEAKASGHGRETSEEHLKQELFEYLHEKDAKEKVFEALDVAFLLLYGDIDVAKVKRSMTAFERKALKELYKSDIDFEEEVVNAWRAKKALKRKTGFFQKEYSPKRVLTALKDLVG